MRGALLRRYSSQTQTERAIARSVRWGPALVLNVPVGVGNGLAGFGGYVAKADLHLINDLGQGSAAHLAVRRAGMLVTPRPVVRSLTTLYLGARKVGPLCGNVVGS